MLIIDNLQKATMKCYILFFTLLLCTIAESQTDNCRSIGYKVIPVQKITGLLDEGFYCADSTGKLPLGCSLGMQSMYVEFYRACYNADSNELILVGRTLLPATAIYISGWAENFPIN